MRIKKYDTDLIIDPEDILLGSDAANPRKPTKNYRIKDLEDYFNRNHREETVSGLVYRYSDGSDNVTPNSRGAMFTDSPYLKQVKNITINRYSEKGVDYALTYNSFIGGRMLLKIANTKDTRYGYFQVLDFVKGSNNPYYELVVDMVNDFAFGQMNNGDLYTLSFEPKDPGLELGNTKYKAHRGDHGSHAYNSVIEAEETDFEKELLNNLNF